MNNLTKACIGVDISKRTLDICINPINKSYKISNAEDAIETFVEELKKFDVKQIACEATGGYEKPLAKVLKKHGYTLWIVDPRRIKGHIVATGCKSKSDKIDAYKIAEFAAKNDPNYEALNKTENQEVLHTLSNRRIDLIQILAAEKTRLKDPSHELCRPSIQNMIQILEKEIKAIELQIKSVIKKDAELSEKAAILESMPGVGFVSAALLLSAVPELGTITNKQIAALMGLAPFENSSGNYVGKRRVRGGRTIPRTMLYMCALTAIKYHPPLKQFYDRLMAAGKPFKVVMVAVMRKLVVLANTLLKKREMCHTFN
jgi:transposase